MFVNFAILSHILYEFTLFILFSILIYRLIKSHLLPVLHCYINEKKALHKNLKNKSFLIDATIISIEGQIKKQKEHLAILEKKIKLWHYSLTQDENDRMILQKKFTEQIHEKRSQQEKQLYIEKVQQEAIPKAIYEAQKDFIEYSKRDGRKLLTNLLISLEKKI